ncbi:MULTISPECIES: molybdenum cofactor biosynthesis protein MoaE [Acidithiobacillus]|uniref:Molybdopterin synthase catalytic subunit n=2 Tax=Acidithiobacillus ferrooxidans TaxID=920 RepID=B7J7F2_ACIF2|nr:MULTISPECIES: molybdenum cofactor biosynthesis protein MoaE [Acidithiobacillus]MBN6747899.1 molybdenum cofactor biosynthesis protein MoaE [Acidithiobacillus sp. PG05]MCL5956751.1 molybdenum cofactor biosynthesis protein MoaE [Gammaproteobacteria bacterium]ACH83332.1 molybdopterin biosynthesis MoaE protein [Acidithiobacillus ferrooxidans ATCC 53993]ACK79991.1 molybdopterin converting factor, subunit 2 [Acidithiobacillus ferrooxidans ATCC 23270]MBN6744561.1 molybdenum cofactor biosynthesis pr
MLVKVQREDFDPMAEMAAFPADAIAGAGSSVTFIGTVRDYSEATDILAMEIEHYPGMTERELERISAEAAQRYDILDSLIMHRYGRLAPQDNIVMVAVWSRHRAAAFDACRFLIDVLKTSAPFWKKEITPEGVRWVTDCPGCRAGSREGHTHAPHVSHSHTQVK